MAENDLDKYETSQGFGDLVQQQQHNRQGNSHTIKVKQYIPSQYQNNQKRVPRDNVSDTMIAKYEESAGDMTSMKDRITIYDQTDRFGLRELSQDAVDEKPLKQPEPMAMQQPARVLSQGPPKQIRINGVTV